jgi:hypothetical protein
MSTTAKQFDAKATLVAALFTEKARLLLELPNAGPIRSAIIRREIAAIDRLIPLYKN